LSSATETAPSAAALLAWYDRHRRTLPWRAGPGEVADPYRVWLSEVMLQQTTVVAVAPRYERFLRRFPSVEALAAADWGDLAEEWAGLGYYARARNLHAAAKAVAGMGGFPGDSAGLAALPGIGRYTAGAVAAIAFGEPVVPADGNVERVMARIHAVTEPLPGSKRRLDALAQGLMADPAAQARPGDVAQALFDLGATICTPRRPACALCPWREGCVAQRQGIQETLPARSPKRARPLRRGVHFLAVDAGGLLLLRRRPPRGLLGGMLEIPGTPWREAPWAEAEALDHAPLAGLAWQVRPGEARHGFTHFELVMQLHVAHLPYLPNEGSFERLTHRAAEAALPGAMRRLLALA